MKRYPTPILPRLPRIDLLAAIDRSYLLIFQCLLPSGLGYLTVTIAALPFVKRRVTDPVFAAKMRDLQPGSLFFHHHYELLFRKTTAFHPSVSFSIGRYFEILTFPGGTSAGMK